MLVIGHRGAKGLAPENTKASFEAALEYKVDAVEFDIRTTQDNIAVVSHDEFLERDKIKLEIAKTDYIEIQRTFPDTLTLSETLSFLDCRVPVIIEVKPGSNISPILKDIENALHGGWKDEYIAVSSFDFELLKNIRRIFPDVRIIVNEKWSGLRAGRRAKKLKTEYITMSQLWLWSGFVHSVSRRGYKLTAYTMNKPQKAEKWAKAGLYGAVTDFPDRFNKE